MRAVLFSGTSGEVEVADVDLDGPGPGEVRVRIAATGVCHSDLHIIRNEWPLPIPMVLGHEGSGVVTELGSGVTDLEIGDHVVLSWVAPCNECRYCLAGQEARCTVAMNLVATDGVLHDGTSRIHRDGETLFHYQGVSSYAAEAIVPASGAIRVRKDAPLDVICLVGCAIATGVGAVTNTAKVEKDATVVVIGCGGVGLSVVQGARMAGASRIVAVDVQPQKTALALTLGATDAIDASSTDPVAALREILPDGADYAFDAIGKIATTEQAIAMLGMGGAAVVVGLPEAGAKASFEPLALAEADQRILGSNYGSVRPAIDFPRLVDQYMAGELKIDELVSARRPLEEASQALEELATGASLRTLLIPEHS
jgi:S-(hydroxymethyl)glutathione dehydrogenase / alcohol dehydrogenase